jgi:hypothetical protein
MCATLSVHLILFHFIILSIFGYGYIILSNLQVQPAPWIKIFSQIYVLTLIWGTKYWVCTKQHVALLSLRLEIARGKTKNCGLSGSKNLSERVCSQVLLECKCDLSLQFPSTTDILVISVELCCDSAQLSCDESVCALSFPSVPELIVELPFPLLRSKRPSFTP